MAYQKLMYLFSRTPKLTQEMPRPLFLSTLVFFDLETTGLPSSKFQPEITELCMLAISRFSLENSDIHPRVENKLNLCFHPTRTISSIASKISGLNSDNLFHQKDFDSKAVDLIQLFLNRLDSPVCLIAHNGFRFDYPLLRAQIQGVKCNKFKLTDCTGAPIVCADSLPLFRVFRNELNKSNDLNDSGIQCADNIPDVESSLAELPLSHSSPKKTNPDSFHLGDVYTRVFGSQHLNAHTAEGDCRAMLKVIQYLGANALDWLQTHYVDFNSLNPMYTLSLNENSVSSNLFPYQMKSSSDSKFVDEADLDFDKIKL